MSYTDTTTLSTMDTTHMSAIALNNIGVTLLQRNCYRESMTVFNHSLTLMRLIIEKKEIDSESNSFLHSASMMLARDSSTNNVRKQKKGNNCDLQLNVICTNVNNGASELIEAAHETPSSSNLFAIRMDNVDNETYSYDSQQSQIESAIVLYNMGTVCRCYAYEASTLSKCPRKIQDMYSKGMKFYSAAYDILSNIMCDEIDLFETQCQGLLIMMILQNLIYISSQYNDIVQARDYYRKLGDIRCELASLDICTLNYEFSKVVCAGAA